MPRNCHLLLVINIIIIIKIAQKVHITKMVVVMVMVPFWFIENLHYRQTYWQTDIDRCYRKHDHAAFDGGKICDATARYCTLLAIIELCNTGRRQFYSETPTRHTVFLEIFAFPETPHTLLSKSTSDVATSNRFCVRRNSAATSLLSAHPGSNHAVGHLTDLTAWELAALSDATTAGSRCGN